MNTNALSYSTDVSEALRKGIPVVALESTIITHGMPYPANRDTALEVESLVKDNNVIPATIAVINGQLTVGLTKEQLDWLAQQRSVMKLSSADLAYAIATKQTGSTTVAATMIAANRAGIDVFATGGIGGVHRGAEQSFDISADLTELGRTDVAVVCAGAKAILDLPLTFEVLETLGVPVIAYGQDTLPAFWSRDSGLEAPLRLNTPEQIAHFINTRRDLAMPGGVLVTNPIEEKHEIPNSEMNKHITQALQDADAKKIRGKSVTPWLLNRILELTNGASLASNQHLMKNNAHLACKIATQLTQK